MSSSTFVTQLLFSDSSHPRVMLKIILDPVMPWETANLTRTAKLQPAFIHSSCLSLVLIPTCQVDLDVQALYSLASVQGQKIKNASQRSIFFDKIWHLSLIAGNILLNPQRRIMKTHGIQQGSFRKVTPVIPEPGDHSSSC